MRESEAMLEIRKIRDANSLRWLKMSEEEINKELDDSTKWFIEEMAKRGKAVELVSNSK